jgi:acetyl esterase/lipase
MPHVFDTLADHYRRSNAIAAGEDPMTLEESRDLNERWGDVTAEPGGVDYLEVEVPTAAGGLVALWAVPHGAATDRVLLCLHGGGFVAGSIHTHRKMFAHIAKAAGVRALVPQYRRTPEAQHPAPVDDATDAYAWLLGEQGLDPAHVALAGDSAGGSLVVTTTVAARRRGLPQPAALLAISPWTDYEQGGETRTTNRATDVLFGGDTPMDIESLVTMFLGPDGDRTDPLVSPLHADLADFPPLYTVVSDAEMLFDDATRLHERARQAGVDATLDVVAGQQHTFLMSAGRSPVADAAIARMAAWARPRLGLA